MTRLLTIGVAAMTILGGLTQARADSPKCDNVLLNGGYVVTLTGWRIRLPSTNQRSARAGVGRLVFDGHGNVSGAETKSHDGVIFPVTFTGTYQVMTDCTGTAHLVTTETGEEHNRNFNFVIIESGEQVMAIQS